MNCSNFSPIVIALNKKIDESSQDALFQLKKKLKILEKSVESFQLKKIGHFGTLDPFAEGMLLVGINGGARLTELSHKYNRKKYLALGRLGIQTDSGDLTGRILQSDEKSEFFQNGLKDISKELIQVAVNSLLGEYWQAPPFFSAAKFQGRKLCDYARDGVKIHKDKVKRTIYKIEIKECHFPNVLFYCEVSTGTYVRTLFEDIANKIGTIGHLVRLQRIGIGNIDLDKSITIEYFNNLTFEEIFSKIALPIETVIQIPDYQLDYEAAMKFCCGQSVMINPPFHGDAWIFVMDNGEKIILGVGSILEENRLKAGVVFESSDRWLKKQKLK